MCPPHARGGVLNQRRTAAERLAYAVLCVAVLSGTVKTARAESAPDATKSNAAFLDSRTIQFTPAPIKRGRVMVVGNAVLGPLVADRKPNDHRPNLYVVAPGVQHRTEGVDPIEFNLVVSGVPRTAEPRDWDVYWALVLDPTLKGDFNSERALLLATQDSFVPGELFEFDDVPAASLLDQYLHIDSVAGLESFRRPDGSLPRLIIVPAGHAIRASALDPDNPPPANESRISRALSRLSHRDTAAASAQGATGSAPATPAVKK